MAARGNVEVEIIWSAIAKLGITALGKKKGSIEKAAYGKGEYPAPILKEVKKIDRELGRVYSLASLDLRAMWAHARLANESLQPLSKLDENGLMELYDVALFRGTAGGAAQKMTEDRRAISQIRDKSNVLPMIGKVALVQVGQGVKPTLKGGPTYGMSGGSGLAAGRVVLDKLTRLCQTNVANAQKMLPRYDNAIRGVRQWR